MSSISVSLSPREESQREQGLQPVENRLYNQMRQLVRPWKYISTMPSVMWIGIPNFEHGIRNIIASDGVARAHARLIKLQPNQRARITWSDSFKSKRAFDFALLPGKHTDRQTTGEVNGAATVPTRLFAVDSTLLIDLTVRPYRQAVAHRFGYEFTVLQELPGSQYIGTEVIIVPHTHSFLEKVLLSNEDEDHTTLRAKFVNMIESNILHSALRFERLPNMHPSPHICYEDAALLFRFFFPHTDETPFFEPETIADQPGTRTSLLRDNELQEFLRYLTINGVVCIVNLFGANEYLPWICFTMAKWYRQRYDGNQALDSLMQAIAWTEHSIDLDVQDINFSQIYTRVSTLAELQYLLYIQTDELQYLDKSIIWTIALIGHLLWSGHAKLYRLSPLRETIKSAIDLLKARNRIPLFLFPPRVNSNRLLTTVDSLVVLLQGRYEQLGALSDLHDALLSAKGAVVCTRKVDSEHLAKRVFNLAIVYHFSYLREREEQDLEMAIAHAEQAKRAKGSNGNSTKHAIHFFLGISYGLKFDHDKTKNLSVIDAAISSMSSACNGLPTKTHDGLPTEDSDWKAILYVINHIKLCYTKYQYKVLNNGGKVDVIDTGARLVKPIRRVPAVDFNVAFRKFIDMGPPRDWHLINSADILSFNLGVDWAQRKNMIQLELTSIHIETMCRSSLRPCDGLELARILAGHYENVGDWTKASQCLQAPHIIR